MRKYRDYTDSDIIRYATEVKSIAGLLKKLNLRNAGGNFDNIKKHLIRLHVNTDHWTGKGWTKDRQLKDWSKYTNNTSVRKQLLKLRGNMCECCRLTEWMNKPITIELHHIDGNRVNNTLENLQLLCPNCHSYTDNWKTTKF